MRTLRTGKGGFTLVELLVVVAVISLLVGILVPVVTTVLKTAEATKSRARVIELSDACYLYQKDAGTYPGQEQWDQLAGSGGAYTGSQVLAACLFDYAVGDLNAQKAPPMSGKHAPVKVGDLDKFQTGGGWTATHTGKLTSVLDRFGEPLAVLYYPYRLNVTSTKVEDVYKYDDNAWYVNRLYAEYKAETGQNISEAQYRENMQKAFVGAGYGKNNVGTARNAGAFLMVAAGKDRLYFTGDDIIYPY